MGDVEVNAPLTIYEWVCALPGLTAVEYRQEFITEHHVNITLRRTMEILNNLVFVGLLTSEKQKGGEFDGSLIYFPRTDCD